MENLEFVALDLETTGLEEQAEIIEIGLVKIKEGKMVDKFETLVKPKNLIPDEIILLTGINNDMVKDKPLWEDIEEKIIQFIGNHKIIAHNANFDKKYLKNINNNLWIDTLNLAKIVFPNLPNYNLMYLSQILKINYQKRHRALADAEVAASLFLETLKAVKTFSPYTLEKIIETLSDHFSGIKYVLTSCQRYLISNYKFEKITDNYPKSDIENISLNISFSECQKLLEPNGVISLNKENYQYRPQQINMLNTICQAFKTEKHAIIEAGTGTGKSLAYLIPALIWAVNNNVRVVVATNTIALQEQLYNNDIPFLEKCFETKFPVAIYKGRNNYICLMRFENFTKQKESLSHNEMIFISQIYSWLEKTENGDKEELNLNSYENELWNKISSQVETCIGSKCKYFSKCYYFKRRKQAEKSKLIITNHSLLLQDIKKENKIIPEYNYLIIDEAHNIEEEAIKQFSFVVDLKKIKKISYQLIKGKTSGILNNLGFRINGFNGYIENKQDIISLSKKCEKDLEYIEYIIDQILKYFVENNSLFYLEEIRITEKVKKQQWFNDLKNMLTELKNYLSTLAGNLISLYYILDLIDAFSEIKKEIVFYQNQILEIKDNIEKFLSGNEKNYVYWIEYKCFNNNSNLILKIAPLVINDLLKERVFEKNKSVILTSATLAIEKKLDYTARLLGLNSGEYLSLIVESPFNYKKQSVICVPTEISDPSQVSEDVYTKDVYQFLKEIIPVVKGGTLILFTSFRMLDDIYYKLKQDKDLINKQILAQGKDGSRSSLVEALKNKANTVVLGTNSFWEGIDVTGDGLTTLILVKLPFAPPTRPIIAAKMELYEKEGKNSFLNFSLPQAILKFRQGHGRLIRSNKDWGFVLILDKRIITKKYGKKFIKSIPAQPLIMGTKEKIINIIQSQMDQKIN